MPSKPIQTVALIGLGALGLMYAHHLSRKMPFDDLRIIADADRQARYRKEPLRCNGEVCRFRFVTPKERTGPADLMLFAVKYDGLEEAIRDAENQIGPDTLILSFLNGIVSEEIIAERCGKEKVLYSVAQGMDGIRSGNELVYQNMGLVCFGEGEKDLLTPRVRRVEEFFLRTDFPHQVDTDMKARLWGKFMLNVGGNQAVAVFRGTYGTIQQPGEARSAMISAMEEVIPLAAAEGVQLTQQDLAYWLGVLDALRPEGKPSLAQDLDSGRPTEVELFAGTVLSLGARHGVDTPVNRFLYAQIKALENR